VAVAIVVVAATVVAAATTVAAAATAADAAGIKSLHSSGFPYIVSVIWFHRSKIALQPRRKSGFFSLEFIGLVIWLHLAKNAIIFRDQWRDFFIWQIHTLEKGLGTMIHLAP
jgi:hypothetical protein